MIPIHIPIGARHVAAIRGAVWKLVDCEYCQERYAYLLELEATGQDHDLRFLDGAGSAARAREPWRFARRAPTPDTGAGWP